MEQETANDQTVAQLQQRLSEQTELLQRFASASQAEEYKEEIGLGEAYVPVTEFRMDRINFLVQHIPTTIIGAWSLMTGPKRLKVGVEEWVDEIHQVFPTRFTQTED